MRLHFVLTVCHYSICDVGSAIAIAFALDITSVSSTTQPSRFGICVRSFLLNLTHFSRLLFLVAVNCFVCFLVNFKQLV